MIKTAEKRDEFIEQNLGLVHTICKRFAGRGIEYDDLYQSGCIGLIKAFDAFDESRGVCFSTYAVPVIMGEIRRLFRDGGSVKVSRSIKELGLRINREKAKYEQENGSQPTVSQLGEILGVSAEEISEAVCAARPPVSLTFESEDGIKENQLPTVSTEDEISDRLYLDEAMEKLSDSEREIINHRYFDLLTQSRTADILNMTQVQVSRAEKKILLKLRDILK